MNIIETKLVFGNGTVRSGDPKGIVLHHAAAENASVETVHSWHKANGWVGIGYHFYVRKDGKIYRGRPENWVGAHTVGHNTKLGVCAEGNFENEEMGALQKNAIVELLRYLFAKYGQLPVSKHKDFAATACPGKNYPFVQIIAAAKEEGAQSESPDKILLAEDGKWGESTTRRLQQIFGTTQDGKVSNQWATYQSDNPGLTTGWDWNRTPNGKGSQLIRAMQAWAGLAPGEQDGEMGTKTIHAIQEKLGTPVDGVVSNPSQMVKALQKWANSQ